ncbi:hypothetical protein X975_26962, partial [Stegodyphus mimosarum]
MNKFHSLAIGGGNCSAQSSLSNQSACMNIFALLIIGPSRPKGSYNRAI